MAKYYGSECKGPGCAGHKAGARYVRAGGRTLTKSSSSFNAGMRIAQKQLRKKGTVTRLAVRKRSR